MRLLNERYEVMRVLGSGGGAVFKALDHQLDRVVALKIRTTDGQALGEDLRREARILLGIPPHPALPLVREDFFDGDLYVIAMDWVDGTDLETLLRTNGRPGLAPSSVLAYLAQTAEALTHLHAQTPPVIHGDVKPANLILTKGGRVKLVDFGLSSAPHLAGASTGSPAYVAPELVGGGTPTRASDVYALAVTASALLTGTPEWPERPTTTDGDAALGLGWHGMDPAVAAQLHEAIRRGRDPDPRQRPGTAGELVERLRAGWTAGLPTGVVTFCMSDIEGSTALWDAHPEAMAAALVRHDELVTDAVEANGGSVVQTMGEGDSTVSVFDSAPAAVRAALAANRALATEAWPPDIAIAVRWGIHTGEVERRNTEFRGPTIIVAARLRGQADGGQVFLSTVTTDLVAGHLPDGYELVDLGHHRLKGLATPEHVRAIKGPGTSAPPPVTTCPYRGLIAYEAADRDFFFGREEVVADLLGRLAPGRLIGLVGASGSGKSSVLRAGLVAAIDAGEAAGITSSATMITPGAEPVLDLADDPNRLVLVDQFEELFTQGADPARRRAFVERLTTWPGPVVVGVRADFYGRLTEYPDLARAMVDQQVLLGTMDEGELERAVRNPARLAGLKLEPGLVDLVLRDVASQPGALPLLSHALRETWERRDGRLLTVDGYRDSGGVASAVARTADAVVDTLPPAQQAEVRNVFLRMTEVGEGAQDTRRRVPIEELVPSGSGDGKVRELLDRLADARLVTLDEGTVEVAHEALIREWPRLRGWLEEDRAGIRAHHQLGRAARQWESGGREASDLYRGARLAGALELVRGGRTQLNTEEGAFVDASTAEDERERRTQLRTNRRLRSLLIASVALLVVAIGAGALSVTQRNRAQDARSASQAQALTSDAERVGALALTAPTLDQSLLLAEAGVTLQSRTETQGDVLAVLQHNPAAVRITPLTKGAIAAFATSPDGKVLAVGDGLGTVRLVSLATWTGMGADVDLGEPVSQQAMAFSADGRTLAVGTRGSTQVHLHIVDVRTHATRNIKAWNIAPIPSPPAITMAFAPDSRRLVIAVEKAAATPDGDIPERLLSLEISSGAVVWQHDYPFKPGQGEAHPLFLPDGTLVTSAPMSNTLLWDAAAGTVIRNFPVGGRFALSADGTRLAIADNNGDITQPTAAVAMLDLHTGKVSRLLATLPDEQILGLAFTRDGTAVVGPAFNSTHVWNLASGRIVESYPGTQRSGTNPGVLIEGRGLALLATSGGSIAAYDPGGGHRFSHRFEAGGAVGDPRGGDLAVQQPDGTIAVFDLRTTRLLRTLPPHDGDPNAQPPTFLADGRIVTGGLGGTVTIWNADSTTVQRQLHFPRPVIAEVASPDGTILAVQQQGAHETDTHVDAVDVATGATLVSRTVHFGVAGLSYTGLVFGGRGGHELVAIGCCEGGTTVLGWDARSGATLFERSPTEPVTSVALSPTTSTLVVGTQLGHFEVWDAETGRPRGPATTAAATPLVSLALSPDGKRLAVAARNGTTSIWDLATANRFGDQFPIDPGVIPGVVYEPGGRLVILEFNQNVEWAVDDKSLNAFACAAAGRNLSREEWRDALPTRSYRSVCPT